MLGARFPSKTLIGRADRSERAHALDTFLQATCRDIVLQRSAALLDFVREGSFLVAEGQQQQQQQQQGEHSAETGGSKPESLSVITRLGRVFGGHSVADSTSPRFASRGAAPPLSPPPPPLTPSPPTPKFKVMAARPSRWKSQPEKEKDLEIDEVFNTWIDKVADVSLPSCYCDATAVLYCAVLLRPSSFPPPPCISATLTRSSLP